jgi:hypothetical protein
MERQMRINEDVLRYLTIKIDAFEEGPSVMMKSRTRDDRPHHYDNDYTSQTPPAIAPEVANLTTQEEVASANETASDAGEENAEGTTL